MKPQSMVLMMLLRRGTFVRCVPLAETNEDIPFEVPDGDHGSVIGSHQAEIFAFFAKHSR